MELIVIASESNQINKFLICIMHGATCTIQLEALYIDSLENTI